MTSINSGTGNLDSSFLPKIPKTIRNIIKSGALVSILAGCGGPIDHMKSTVNDAIQPNTLTELAQDGKKFLQSHRMHIKKLNDAEYQKALEEGKKIMYFLNHQYGKNLGKYVIVFDVPGKKAVIWNNMLNTHQTNSGLNLYISYSTKSGENTSDYTGAIASINYLKQHRKFPKKYKYHDYNGTSPLFVFYDSDRFPTKKIDSKYATNSYIIEKGDFINPEIFDKDKDQGNKPLKTGILYISGDGKVSADINTNLAEIYKNKHTAINFINASEIIKQTDSNSSDFQVFIKNFESKLTTNITNTEDDNSTHHHGGGYVHTYHWWLYDSGSHTSTTHTGGHYDVNHLPTKNVPTIKYTGVVTKVTPTTNVSGAQHISEIRGAKTVKSIKASTSHGFSGRSFSRGG